MIRQPISIDEYREMINKQMDTFAVLDLLEDGYEKNSRMKLNAQAHEHTVSDLFYAVFAGPRANDDLIESYRNFMNDTIIPINDKCMLVSALTMNVMQRFDSKKIGFMIDVVQFGVPETAIRAVIGLIPVFQIYASRWKLYPEIVNRLEVLADDPLFTKLFSKKSDFIDIFALPLDFHKIEILSPITGTPENLQRIALYYFEKNHFEEALEAYTLLAGEGLQNAEVWQKIGYCRQMLGNIRGALDAYLNADLINENNPWALRRIAQCYRLLKQPKDALEYYRRLEQLKPNDLNIQLNIGHCYLELKNFAEALNYYFKVELIDSSNTRAWRSIAWCAFLSRKFDIARSYYAKIIESKPNAQDYMNAGHVELCTDNIKTAIELYEQSLKLSDSFETFATMLHEDENELRVAGVNIELLPIIMDKIRYDQEENH